MLSVRNSLLLSAVLFSCFQGAALSQDNKPQSNTMGPVINNQGIVTQGQIGNNTIVNPIRRDPNGVYQGDTQIGSAPPPVIDEATGIARFQAMSFRAYANPSAPLEYGNLLLSPEGAPVERPGVFVGSLSVMIAGFQARIVGRR
jgi:hypothetical protein